MAISEELKIQIKAEVTGAIAELKKFQQTADNSKNSVDKLQNKMAAWVKGIGAAYISIRGLQMAMKYGLEASQIAADASQIGRALDSMAKRSGTSATEIVASLKRASGGTIAELDLMRSASKAALFDLPMDQMGRLMEIARASATATGESVQYMFDSIVTGIARSSPMILDNLGLTIKVGQATEKYAASIGKSVEQLTAEEKKMATLNAVLEAGGSIIERVGDAAKEFTDAERAQKYKAAMADLKKEIGVYLLPAFREVVTQSTELAESLAEIVRLRNAMRAVKQGTAEVSQELMVVNHEIENMQIMLSRRQEGGGMYERELEALKARRALLIEQQRWEERVGHLKNEQAKAAAEAAAKEAARAEALSSYLKEVDAAYSKTEEGQREALESAIAYWESQLATADKTAPKIIAIIKELKEELAGMGDEPVEAMEDIVEQMRQFYLYAGQGMGTATKNFEDWVAFLEEAKELAPGVAQDLSGVRDAMAGMAAEGMLNEGQWEEYLENLKTAEEQFQSMRRAIAPFAEALGEMIVNAKDGAEAFKEAMKAAFASVLEMLAKEAFVRAAAALAGGNIPGVALWTAAGTAAMVAKGAVQALGEGGIVTKPTHALIGERGPEAVIPLNKAGGLGTVNVYVQGSVLSDEDLSRKVASVVRRSARGY